MLSLIDFVTGLIALAYFLVIAAATRQHFTSEKYPVGMYIISFLSLVGISTFMAFAFLQTINNAAVILALIGIAFAIFFWAAKHSQETRLGLAFADDASSSGIITSGPWQYIRHPFYVSYIIFWAACAWGTANFLSIVVFAALLFIYVYSAMREEMTLKNGSFGDEYLTYQRKTGFFFPKRLSRN